MLSTHSVTTGKGLTMAMSDLYRLVNTYYWKRRLKWPSELESLAWVVTEMAEAIEILMARTEGWVRNNPEDKPDWDLKEFCTELGDAMFMLQVMGMAAGGDPMGCILVKLEDEHEDNES